MCVQILGQVVPIKPLCSDGFSQTDKSDKDGQLYILWCDRGQVGFSNCDVFFCLKIV